MYKFWNTIGDFFEFSFNIIKSLGNTINYIYILIIFIFLVIWTYKMLQHKKNNEEHAPL